MPIHTTEQQKETYQSVKNTLTDLMIAVSQAQLDTEQTRALKETLQRLEDIFLIVVVGEFNAGKSSFINALLDTTVLAAGVTPTTAQIHLIRHGEEQSVSPIKDWGLLVTIPSPILKTISFVDTPGTNTILSDHEVLTKWFLPQADMVLFLSSADRPYSESENRFLHDIKEWQKKVLIVLNKIDLLQTDEEREHVLAFIRENAKKHLNEEITVIPVSARMAQQARKDASAELWRASGFENLETYIHDKLDQENRFILKMDSALGIGARAAANSLEQLENELRFYREDQKLAESIQSQIVRYQDDMKKEISRSMKEIDAIFLEIKNRGNDYFEKLFQVRNLPNILKKEKNQLEFEDQVLQNLPTEVERKTTEMVETIYLRQQQITQSVMKQIETRKSEFPQAGIPQHEKMERASLLQKMQSAIDEMVKKMEQDIAGNIGMKHVQSALTTALAIEVSAIGIGAGLTLIATTVATDILGIVAAFWIGIAGFLVLPYYRKKSQREFEAQMEAVRVKLVDSLRREFTEEVNAQVANIEGAIQPFSRFIETTIQKVEQHSDQISAINERTQEIKAKLQ